MLESQWAIITGGPSSGKTTLINELESMGYPVRHEVARAYILHLMKCNHVSAEEVRQQVHPLQRHILTLKLMRERHTPKNDRVFFDRGTPDSLAYFRYHKLNTQDAVRACRYVRYKHVFFCSPLPFEKDGIRTENEEVAKILGQYIFDAYVDMGYQPILLPPVSISDRLSIILNKLS